ncbi:hypothetical protein UlMin_044964 [Ulmus minor]
MKLPFLSKQTEAIITRSTWPWPSCTQTRTLSFRTGREILKTMNSTFLDTNEPLESFFTDSPESASFSTEPEENSGGDPVEAVIQGLRSERLFFEPGQTSSLMEEAKEEEKKNSSNKNHDNIIPFKESLALSMESQNPYLDFKKSMEEMVEAHGLKDWEALEELLSCYLKINGKDNHGYIIGAFLDLLVGFSVKSFPSCDSPCSPLSFCNTSSTTGSSSSSSTPCVSSIGEAGDETPCLSSLLEAEEEEMESEEKDDDGSS